MNAHPLDHIVVVGGGLAAARCCEQLRRHGHAGRITMLSAERHEPYDRPPLSKNVLLGTRDHTSLGVDFAELRVDLQLGVTATGLGVADRVVTTTAGELPYDGVAIATGASAVRLPGDGQQFTVRTVDDALRLRGRLSPGKRVVVIGASWIGAEVATAALAHGCHVTCVGAGPAPLANALGAEVGNRLVPWWNGVDLRLNTRAEAVADDGVLLAGGEWVDADVVVTGIGVRQETSWLASSGLELDQGVVVDEWLRAAPGVVAIGDVAAWWSRRWQRRMRIEHWDDAASGPAVAAAALLQPCLGNVDVHDPVPYFWSDQFGHRLQYTGAHGPLDTLIWREREGGKWTAVWVDAAGRLTGALVADLPREMAQARIAITCGIVADPDMIADASVPLSKVGQAA